MEVGDHRVDRPPDMCPRCHTGIEPRLLATNKPPVASDVALQLIYCCPLRRCGQAFIANYYRPPRGLTSRDLQLGDVVPIRPQDPQVHRTIKTLSPEFVEIYGQSAAAEQLGLDQIAGIGYRKALEFIIKDYCLHRSPAEAEAIRREPLARCIDRYVGDKNVRSCAQRAAWIGNDEAHYQRRWPSKDIEDLKTLIDLSMAWIVNELLTEQYEREMPEGT